MFICGSKPNYLCYKTCQLSGATWWCEYNTFLIITYNIGLCTMPHCKLIFHYPPERNRVNSCGKRNSTACCPFPNSSNQLCHQTYSTDAKRRPAVPAAAWTISSWRMRLQRLWTVANSSGWSTNGWLSTRGSLEQGELFLFLERLFIIFSFRHLFWYFGTRCELTSITKQQFTKPSNSDAHQWYASPKTLAKANPLKIRCSSEKC